MKNNLRHFRIAAGLSQMDLAQATGITQGMISQYERNSEAFGSMSLHHATMLAKALGVGLQELVGVSPTGHSS
jgi:transcriptional regulator with XRE-family HTH domain